MNDPIIENMTIKFKKKLNDFHKLIHLADKNSANEYIYSWIIVMQTLKNWIYEGIIIVMIINIET